VIYDSGAEELRAIAVLDDGSVAVGTNKGTSGSSTGSAGSGAGWASRYALERLKCGVFLVQPDGSAPAPLRAACDYVYALAPGDNQSVWLTTGNPPPLPCRPDRKFALLGATESKQLLHSSTRPRRPWSRLETRVLYALGAGLGPLGPTSPRPTT